MGAIARSGAPLRLPDHRGCVPRGRRAAIGDGRSATAAISDIAVFSFHPVKIITTGEGGMALTNDAGARRADGAAAHATASRATRRCSASADEGAWYYEQQLLGFNYRMTDIQAALGLSQLQRARRASSQRRRRSPTGTTKRSQACRSRARGSTRTRNSSWHLYVIRVDASRSVRRPSSGCARPASASTSITSRSRAALLSRARLRSGDWPEAERYYAEAISLPLYPGLTEEEQDRVIAAVKDVLGCA